jgi:hypothetical protein
LIETIDLCGDGRDLPAVGDVELDRRDTLVLERPETVEQEVGCVDPIGAALEQARHIRRPDPAVRARYEDRCSGDPHANHAKSVKRCALTGTELGWFSRPAQGAAARSGLRDLPSCSLERRACVPLAVFAVRQGCRDA